MHHFTGALKDGQAYVKAPITKGKGTVEMADLTVETSALVRRAGSFTAAGEEHRRAGALDGAGTEADIAAFGEINAVLHDGWRTLKSAQSQAWTGLGASHEEHAEKLSGNARGYETTESAGAAQLRRPTGG